MIKKKNVKGFTLIELIIVMAIMTILMAALMQMMKPIRRTFVDSTLYEAQRNTQNGITQYLSESTRYATNLGIYQPGENATYNVGSVSVTRSVSNVTSAVNYFLDDVSGKTAADNMPNSTEKTQAQKAANKVRAQLESKVQVITIDNGTSYTYNGASCTGRILRNKQPTTLSAQWETSGTVGCRMALSPAYYGDSSYTISFENLTGTEQGLKFMVSSVPDSILMPNTLVSTETVTPCPNLYTNKTVIYDYGLELLKGVSPGFTKADLDCVPYDKPIFDVNLVERDASNLPVTSNKKTYIVFLTPNDLK